MKSVFFRAAAGLVAGVLAWAILEPSAPKAPGSLAWSHWENLYMLLVSALIALAIGAVGGWQRGSMLHAVRESLLGMLFGAIGGLFGASIGGTLAHTFMPNIDPQIMPTPLLAAMGWRTLVFLPIGGFIGFGIGAAGLSVARTIQGAIGGIFAGAVAGLLFDPIGAALGGIVLTIQNQTSGETGGPSRALLAGLLGLGIGLFIGLAERIMRSAWVRLLLGRNEGKEWAMDRAQMSLGRSESADIPLRGDPNVAPVHAFIAKTPQGYLLADHGSPIGTYLNGQRISQAPLNHGDFIQIGGFQLQFLLKAGAHQAVRPEMRPMSVPIGGHYSAQPPQAGVQGNTGFGTNGQPGSTPIQVPGGIPTQMGQMPSGFGPSAPNTGQMTVGYGANPVPGFSSGGFQLIVLDGPLSGQVIKVDSMLEVGREGSGIKLSQDAQSSRRHARFSSGTTGILVEDLGSTNGTYLNQSRISRQEAHVGDIIRVGATNFRVESN